MTDGQLSLSVIGRASADFQCDALRLYVWGELQSAFPFWLLERNNGYDIYVLTKQNLCYKKADRSRKWGLLLDRAQRTVRISSTLFQLRRSQLWGFLGSSVTRGSARVRGCWDPELTWTLTVLLFFKAR